MQFVASRADCNSKCPDANCIELLSSSIRSSNSKPECTGNGLNFKLWNLINDDLPSSHRNAWDCFAPLAENLQERLPLLPACFRGNQFAGLWWADFNKIILWFVWLDFAVGRFEFSAAELLQNRGEARRAVCGGDSRLVLFVLGVLCELFEHKKSCQTVRSSFQNSF